MSIPRDEIALARIAVKGSCVPLLYGSDKAVRETARQLYRDYRLHAYALLPKESRRSLFSPFYLTRIPVSYDSPQLLVSLTVRFFQQLDSSAVPILIDCSEEGLFLRDQALRTFLEGHCFLSDHAHYGEIPPFCYLTTPKSTERSDCAP